MAMPPRPDGRLPEAPAPPVDSLTDDVLASILIRLPTLADFGRAAVACPTFRRVIADPAFLRRMWALHPPLLLGFLHLQGRVPHRRSAVPLGGQWHAVASPTWKDLDPAKSRVTVTRRLLPYGCFYWMMMSITPSFLVLDMARMEFSLLKYPSPFSGQASVIVEAGEGRLGMFSFNAKFGESFELDIFSTVCKVLCRLKCNLNMVPKVKNVI
ncbi:hypothetical protein HU200_054619 [Digitaria exilis]|uniref:F-box domain-containing protein n=1 Tax=Digitaria exilis TaxID=1010633 RepID=A0A835E7D3_9POAL|nr:hypothetical protein HU200_054619 [Digitaria exilis]